MRFDASGFKELSTAMGAASEHMARAFTNVVPVFIERAQEVIENSLIQAAAKAGPDAFPPQYIQPMIDAAQGILIAQPGEVVLDFEQLGTVDDLVEGFHYGAKIEGGGQVDLPYGGEVLKNDVNERYQAWLRILHGETWHGLDYSSSWSETIQARLDAWEGKAPQWLLLQYGQTEWEPTIQPNAIVEDVTAELFVVFDRLLLGEVNEIVAAINKPKPTRPTDKGGI